MVEDKRLQMCLFKNSQQQMKDALFDKLGGLLQMIKLVCKEDAGQNSAQLETCSLQQLELPVESASSSQNIINNFNICLMIENMNRASANKESAPALSSRSLQCQPHQIAPQTSKFFFIASPSSQKRKRVYFEEQISLFQQLDPEQLFLQRQRTLELIFQVQQQLKKRQARGCDLQQKVSLRTNELE